MEEDKVLQISALKSVEFHFDGDRKITQINITPVFCIDFGNKAAQNIEYGYYE